MVFKPSELVPLTGQPSPSPSGQAARQTCGHRAGRRGHRQALVAADIDMVGFVGSRGGPPHQAACAALKRLVLELGARTDDQSAPCGPPRRGRYAVRESMRNSGQVCCRSSASTWKAAAERYRLVVEKARASRSALRRVFMGRWRARSSAAGAGAGAGAQAREPCCWAAGAPGPAPADHRVAGVTDDGALAARDLQAHRGRARGRGRGGGAAPRERQHLRPRRASVWSGDAAATARWPRACRPDRWREPRPRRCGRPALVRREAGGFGFSAA